MDGDKKLILALDVHEYEYALDLVDKFHDHIGIFKIGLELFLAAGPGIIEEIHRRGRKVFLDLKFHDIPTTVSKAAVVAAKLGVHMFTVHASGGFDMMKQCCDRVVQTCLKENIERPKILGVTVLTSISKEMLRDELGIQYGMRTHVKHLAALSRKAGLDGVVSSAREVEAIRNSCGRGFLIVTPGIRPSWSLPDDQRRTMTPKEAIREGADYLVMGRAILQQNDPLRAVELINLEILSA
ncbi:MAG: orotidine-5'-phosphate decarboxylase [Nitrospirota bacterium]